MLLVNVGASTINLALGYTNDYSDVIDSSGFTLFFCALYFLCALPKMNIDISLRIPILRIIFWSFMLLIEIVFYAPLDGEPSYILYLVNNGLCNFWNTIYFTLPFNHDFYLIQVWLLSVVLFAVYEWGIIKLAQNVIDKFVKPVNGS
mgnify:FL=1